MEIYPGMILEVRTATDETVAMRALRKPEQGRDFPVVWVCTEREYVRAEQAGDDPHGIPWPLDAVRVLEHP